MNINLRELTYDQVNELRIASISELERRDNLEEIPNRIADLSRTYRDGGGDPSKLTNAITEE